MKRSEVLIINGSDDEDDIIDIEDYWGRNALRSGFCIGQNKEHYNYDAYQSAGFILHEYDCPEDPVTSLMLGPSLTIYLFKCNIPALANCSFIQCVESIDQLPQEFED